MMGKGIRYTDEFKQEAVNQVVVHGYPVGEVSHRLDISICDVSHRENPSYVGSLSMLR